MGTGPINTQIGLPTDTDNNLMVLMVMLVGCHRKL